MTYLVRLKMSREARLLLQKVRIKNITDGSQNSQHSQFSKKQNCLHCPLKKNSHIKGFIKQGYFLGYNQLGHGNWLLGEICFGLNGLFTDNQIERQ